MATLIIEELDKYQRMCTILDYEHVKQMCHAPSCAHMISATEFAWLCTLTITTPLGEGLVLCSACRRRPALPGVLR